MLEVLRTDFMRTARAKGLREGAVILRHGVRNALLPVITIAGIVLADVATGAFFVETIYQVPGSAATWSTALPDATIQSSSAPSSCSG